MALRANPAFGAGTAPRSRAGVAGADVLIAAALAIFSVLYLWPFRDALVSLDPDEGIILQGAARILTGQLPYRDFFSFYAPGSYYWNAWLMRAFGDSILVPRTALLVYGALFSLITFLLARRMASRAGALFATLALLVCCLPLRFLVMHNWDSTVAALLALCCGLEFLRRPAAGWAAGVGGFASLALLCNQARGGGLLLGLALGFLALRPRLRQSGAGTRHFLLMGIVFLLPLAATVAFFAAHGALGAMAQGLLWAPLNYTQANHLPYGWITMTIVRWEELFRSGPLALRALYLFIISPVFVLCALPIAVALVALSCWWKPRPDLDPEEVSAVVLTGAVTLGSVLSIWATRADFHHVTFIAPLFFFLLPWIAERWAAPFAGLRQVAPLVAVYLLLAVTAYGLTLLWQVRGTSVQVQTRRGLVRIPQQNQTLDFIQAHFPPGSQLLIHPYLPLYSYLTRTVSPLPYDYLQAGMHTPQQFQDAVARLEALRPGAVLYEPDFVLTIVTAWPNTPLRRMTEDPAADYLARNYRACAVFDRDPVSPAAPFVLLVRKDLPCSDYR